MKEFDTKTAPELRKLVAEKRESLRQFRFSSKGSRIRDTKLGAALRKDVARLMTVLHTMNTTTENK